MTKDDIIAMAREAGLEVHPRKEEIRVGTDAMWGFDSTPKVKRFAALVAAAEREACAKVCEQAIERVHHQRMFGRIVPLHRITDAIRARAGNNNDTT